VNGWTIELSKSARREFRLLDEGAKQDAMEILQDLAEEGPVVVPAIELKKYPDAWRARFHHERFRIVYLVSRTRKRIVVIRIRPRPIAYVGLKKPGPKNRKP
jgi:mRNA-degrading endonuclease RelE of RelBE toxin-antitoxin system